MSLERAVRAKVNRKTKRKIEKKSKRKVMEKLEKERKCRINVRAKLKLVFCFNSV